MNNYTYMTMLTNDNYVYGVIMLFDSLQKVKSQYPLTVLVTEDVAEATLEILSQLNISYKQVQSNLLPKNIFENNILINQSKAGQYYNIFTKFEVFNQIEYEKIIYLDADILVLKNLDHLFKKPHMTAAFENEYYNKKNIFNTGCLVISPSMEEYNKIISFYNDIIQTNNQEFISDQSILNSFYSNWKDKIELHLNKYYNIFANQVLDQDLEQIKTNGFFIHFVDRKPWKFAVKKEEEKYSEYYYELAKNNILSYSNSFDWATIVKKVKLSIYAICKNEKEYIDKWVKCFTKADYVCVLDTGSTDGTWELLQEYSKIYPNLIISQEIISPWRFDAARNKSLTLVPKDTTLYFMMDLDEIIKEDNWVDEIKRRWDPSFDRAVYQYYRNVDEHDQVLRDIPEFRIHTKEWDHYVNMVHENLVRRNNDKYFIYENCTKIPIIVWHYPRENKKTQYAELCEKELQEHPENVTMKLQLAIEYEILKEGEKAKKWYQNMIDNDSNTLFQHELGRCYTGIGCYYLDKEDIETALIYFREGRIAAPQFADNYLIAAQKYFDIGQYQQAIDLCLSALDNCLAAVWCNITDICSFSPYYLLGISYYQLQNIEKSIMYMSVANQLNNNLQNVLNDFINQYYEKMKYKASLDSTKK